MGGVVVLPLRVSRNHSTLVECDREATFGQPSWPAQPPRWSSQKERPRRASAASFTASAALDNAKHARHPHFGDDAPQFEAKPFARHPAFGRGDKRSLSFGSSTVCEWHPPRTIRSTLAAWRARSPQRPRSWSPYPRVSAPVPDAQHAQPLRRCSCPAHYTADPAR